MDVTRENFGEELDGIVSAIEESTFLAIDGEFTGLDADGCNHNFPLDTPVERYAKLKNGSTDFLFLQFGLCAFRFDETKQMYEAKPYNFYIFPRPAQPNSPDKRFLCQASSIDFLVGHGFDFNKAFRQGIPYLSQQQEHKMREKLELKHQEANNRSLGGDMLSPDATRTKRTPVPVPEEHKEFINDISKKFSLFLESDESQSLDLQPTNAFQRRLVYQLVEEKFPLIHLESKSGEHQQRYLVAHKVNDPTDLVTRQQERQALELIELENQLGFTKVMQAITKSGKLVVGHNMILDVLHSVTHFYGPLPDVLDDFKSLMKTIFPKLLDTKLMANTNPFKEFMLQTSLDALLQTLNSKPFEPAPVKIADGFENYESGDSFHEAGYDAFVTGCCLATMSKFLGKFQKEPSQCLLPTSQVLDPFVNKLYLMRIFDIPYLNLGGPDLEVKRDHVFHATFPKEWKSSDLHSIFEPYGDIRISWLSDQTAYVSLMNKKYSKLALASLKDQRAEFNIVSYDCHQRSKSVEPSSALKRKTLSEREPLPGKIKRRHLSNDRNSGQTVGDDGEHEDMGTRVKDTAEGDEQNEASNNTEQTQEASKLFDESSTW